MEDSVHNSRKVIQTYSNLLWTYQFFSNFSNEILQNLIDTSKVASFIDNVIVGTKKEEEHDKVVEEVEKRLVENDLYVKYK